MTDDVLLRAERLFSRRRFGEAIRILEPQVYRFRESFDFYHLLGRSCIRTGDIAGAYSYLRRAEQLRPGDAGVLQLMAAIYHRRGERERALETYLEVLEASPGDRWARRGLDQLQHEFRDDAGAGGRRGGGQVAIDRLAPDLLSSSGETVAVLQDYFVEVAPLPPSPAAPPLFPAPRCGLCFPTSATAAFAFF